MTPKAGAILSITTACLATLAAACMPQKSERELLIEASTLVASQRFDEAQVIFEQVHAANPDSAEVLIRYAGFAIDAGDLERAREFFVTLDTLELNANERGRFDNERRRYFERIYEEARGETLDAPADQEAYETAILGLVSLDRSGPYLEEYLAYLIMQARSSLGAAPDRALRAADAGGPAANATLEQARASLVYLDRLLDGDDRLGLRGRPEAAVEAEANALRGLLRRKIFDGEWLATWNQTHRQPFIDAGRFDANIDRFTLHYVGPHREGSGPTTSIDVLTVQAQTWFARELATDLAYELAGIERAGAAPLGYSVADFTQAQATNLATDPEGNFTFDLTLPLGTVQLGGWLLHERLEAASQPAAEGSGAQPAAAGADEGSGR